MKRTFGTILVGAGPAAVGPLVSAYQQNQLDELLGSGLLYVDPNDQFGAGSLGNYAIHSDTSASTLLETLAGGDQRVREKMLASPLVAEIQKLGHDSLPLKTIGNFLGQLGEAILDVLKAYPQSDFYPRARVTEIRQTAAGQWQATIARTNAADERVVADRIVIGCGGVQRRERMLAASIGKDYTLVDAGVTDRVMTSDELLRSDGPQKLADRVRGIARPRITVIGASHSAMCCAWALLNLTNVNFGQDAITLLHGHAFPIFYPTREDALAAGYTAFNNDDICPITKRLFRLAGLRMKTRELAIRVLRIGSAVPETRVRLQRLDRTAPPTAANRAAIADADVIITALGYRPNNPPLFDAAGRRITLLSDDPVAALPMVDIQCRVLDANEIPVPNVYGTGLASGFKYNGELGGEPSFVGQANSLWLYQNGIGDILRKWMITPPLRDKRLAA